MNERIEAGFIVEGHGDVKAVPVLFHRLVSLYLPGSRVTFREPFHISRDKLKKAGNRELERTVEFVARKLHRPCVILILIDAERDCPAELGPGLLKRASRVRSDIPVAVVLAKHEFENWFLAAAESLAGKRNLPASLNRPGNPEGIPGAKEWLSKRMQGHPYKETTDQEPLTRQIDLEQARVSPSFDKLCREVLRVIALARGDG